MEQDNYIDIRWWEADIASEARSMGVELTSEEARQILYRLRQEHDPNIGINWEVIHEAIENHEYYRGDYE